LEKWVTELHLDFPILIDDGQTAQRYVATFPSYFLIYRDGTVALSKPSLPSATDMVRFVEADEE
jgi:hypothetical protein